MARLFQLLSLSIALSLVPNAWAIPSSGHALSSRHEQIAARHLHGDAVAKTHRKRRTCKAPGVSSSSTSTTSSTTTKTTTKAAPTTKAQPKATTTKATKAAQPTSNTNSGSSNSNSGSSNSGSSNSGSSNSNSGSSTSNSGSSSSGSNTSSGDEQQYLSIHNTERAKRGANPLSWDDDLAAAAQTWANKCTNQHSGGTLGPYGENLAAGTGDFSISDGLQLWIDEAKDYNPSNPTFSHWSQMVWKSTTKLGCAVATCDGIFPGFGAASYYVCEYFPQGNILSQFGANVQL